MSRFVLAEQGHTVQILAPVDVSGGLGSDIFSMAEYDHASIILQFGVSAAAVTKVQVEKCSDFAASVHTPIAFNVYKEETAGGDTLGSRVACEAAAGLVPNAADNIFYVIEIDAAELGDGYDKVRLLITNGVNSVIASAVAVLSGARFASVASPTVVA